MIPGWQYAVDIAQIVVLPLLGALFVLTRKLRTNDLRHIEKTLERIETKLDNHIQWHLRGAWRVPKDGR